jgi:hypothetical protein
VVIWCWIVIHTSNGANDNRSYEKVKGYVMSDETHEHNWVNFYESFMKKHVDLTYNKTVQLVNENECLYGK